MKIGLGIVLASMLLVVVEGFASYHWSHNFWPSQVAARWSRTGISFFAHGGMWGDFLLLPALFAFIITRYGASWSLGQIALMAAIGVAVTLANHLLLIFTQVIPDPLGWKEEKWSTVIALHFVYMSTYVALAGLFYFSPGVSVKAAVVVSVVLGLHMAAGTHVPLGLMNLWQQWWWCPNSFLTNPVIPYLSAVIWVTLAIFATVAAGWRAGFWVAITGATLAGLVLSIIQAAPPAPDRFYGS